MFVDASAFCAILLGEPEGPVFENAIWSAGTRVTSAIAVWETARALVREHGTEVIEAGHDLTRYMASANIELVVVGALEQSLALEAFDRFGKGRHPAQLNMGDCFAYACARSQGMPLLFKGDDFSQTDIEAAVRV